MKSPVLFIIFKRENTTKRVFDRIREARPPKLYIAADGPRESRPEEKVKCEQTRKIVELIDWDCEVHRLYRDKNLGCGKGVSSAITWFFQHEEQGIILEDDVLPNKDFFSFCDEMLDRYKDNHQIQLVAGFNFFFDGYSSPYSYYMSRFLQIWGWASWKRVWDTYENDISRLPQSNVISCLKKCFPRSVYRYYKKVYFSMLKRESDTWDHQFFFNQLLYNRYSIIPYHNLISNIGCGTEEASHITNSGDRMIELIIEHESESLGTLRHPDQMYYDSKADLIYAINSQVSIRPFIIRVINRISGILFRSR